MVCALLHLAYPKNHVLVIRSSYKDNMHYICCMTLLLLKPFTMFYIIV